MVKIWVEQFKIHTYARDNTRYKIVRMLNVTPDDCLYIGHNLTTKELICYIVGKWEVEIS